MLLGGFKLKVTKEVIGIIVLVDFVCALHGGAD